MRSARWELTDSLLCFILFLLFIPNWEIGAKQDAQFAHNVCIDYLFSLMSVLNNNTGDNGQLTNRLCVACRADRSRFNTDVALI